MDGGVRLCNSETAARLAERMGKELGATRWAGKSFGHNPREDQRFGIMVALGRGCHAALLRVDFTPEHWEGVKQQFRERAGSSWQNTKTAKNPHS